MIHVYCGDGKGKTTAAIGLIVRFIGHGRRVMLVQFLKDGSSGELAPLEKLSSIRILTGCPGIVQTNVMSEADLAATRVLQAAQLEEAIQAACRGEIDLLVLDEACAAMKLGLLPEDKVLDFLNRKPAGLEVVLTGRDPSAALLALADYVSEIHAVKHPYQRGIRAREGVEY